MTFIQGDGEIGRDILVTDEQLVVTSTNHLTGGILAISISAQSTAGESVSITVRPEWHTK
jgi:hypothetical protein